MKKSNLIVGIAYLLLGGCLVLLAIFSPESRLNSLLFGFGFGIITPGLMTIGKYIYWHRPDKLPQYQEKIRQENIMLHDELQVKLRDKSGRLAFLLGICVISVSMIVFSILGALEMVASSRLIVLYLSAFLLFQLIAYVFIYCKLARRY